VNVTTADSSEAMREASLEALGYICRDLTQAVMESSTNQILTAIVHGMRDEKSVHVQMAATNALLNSLVLARTYFENEVIFSLIKMNKK
jgi:importin subunit beta-1